MTFHDWVYQNYTIENTIDGDVIDWGNGVKTPVSAFETFFNEAGQNAIDNNLDVKQELLKTEIGQQFKDYI